MYTSVFLEAIARGIPLYIVGSTSAALLNQLRDAAVLASAIQGATDADGRALVHHIGATEESLARQLAPRLLSLGTRRAFCIYTNKDNIAFQDRCAALQAALEGSTCVAVARFYYRSISALQLALTEISDELAVAGVPSNMTALIVMDARMHFIVSTAAFTMGVLAGAHVAVFESSLELLQGVRAGSPLTIVDQPFYSEAYAAVALAAYELQTGEALANDVAPTPRLLFQGQVTAEDMVREACREEGYPVCGDPGVADVSPGGCPCFNSSSVHLRVMAMLPTTLPLYWDVLAGLEDAKRDFVGSSYQWERIPVAVFSAMFAAADTYDAANSTKWSSAVSSNHFYVPGDPRVGVAMEALGRSKGNRTFFLTLDADNSVPAQDFLDTYQVDAYIGPTSQGSATLGAYVRETMPEYNEDVKVYSGLLFASKWAQMSRAFVDGFFAKSLSYADGFWDFPVKGDLRNCSGVFTYFHAQWTPTGCQVCPQTGILCFIRNEFDPPTALQILPSPPAVSEQAAYVDQLRVALQPAPGTLATRVHTLVVIPLMATDLPRALALLEQQGMRGYDGNATRVLSLHCSSSDWQALAYPESLVGGQRYGGCIDWQTPLAMYITYMAAVLARQTRGERLFQGVLSTDRLVTRDRITPAAARRRADCALHRVRSVLDLGRDLSFSVCDHTAGCGANGSRPCSGRGACQFPNASINAASLVELDPTVGWCVCEPGVKGSLCEQQGGDGHGPELLKWLLMGGGLLLVSAVTLGSYFWCTRRVTAGQERRKLLKAKRRRPPQLNERLTVVLTDIEDSTRLWEWDPSVMDRSLQIHHKVLRELLGKHYGYECDTEGDAFEVVFHDASDALRWTLEVQLALLYPERLLGAPEGAQIPHAGCWPDELLLHPSGEEVYGKNGSVLYRGLRVRAGIHTGMAESAYLHENGRRRYVGKVMDTAKAIVDAASQGGQVLMSMDAWAALGPAAFTNSLHLVVHNMGEHLVDRELPPLQLMEVLPQSLQKRAPFKPIKSIQQLAPSFFDAPSSASYVHDTPPSEPVVIMFTFVETSPALKRRPKYSMGVQLLAAFVRQTLGMHSGYECEEKNGNFLIAFSDPLHAVLFSQDLQVGAMALPWPEELLAPTDGLQDSMLASTPPALCTYDDHTNGGRSSTDPYNSECYRGLRVKCGFYWDLPTRCLPHASTGRASYFGPLMNRAARIACHAADGQTLCSAEVVDAVSQSAEVLRRKLSFAPLGPCALKGISMPIVLFQVSSPLTHSRMFSSSALLAAHPLPFPPNPLNLPNPPDPPDRHCHRVDFSSVWRPEDAEQLLRGEGEEGELWPDLSEGRKSHTREPRSWVVVDMVSQPLRRLYHGRRVTT
eukprot:jgi/Mesvir1/28165/Mv04727-RA.3